MMCTAPVPAWWPQTHLRIAVHASGIGCFALLGGGSWLVWVKATRDAVCGAWVPTTALRVAQGGVWQSALVGELVPPARVNMTNEGKHHYARRTMGSNPVCLFPQRNKFAQPTA